MKTYLLKIILGLTIFSVLFLCAGIYYFYNSGVGNFSYIKNLKCDNNKSIQVNKLFDGNVNLKLSGGQTLELTVGPVLASYPGMLPYFQSQDGSIIFGESQNGSFNLTESLTTKNYRETYRNCR